MSHFPFILQDRVCGSPEGDYVESPVSHFVFKRLRGFGVPRKGTVSSSNSFVTPGFAQGIILKVQSEILRSLAFPG